MRAQLERHPTLGRALGRRPSERPRPSASDSLVAGQLISERATQRITPIKRQLDRVAHCDTRCRRAHSQASAESAPSERAALSYTVCTVFHARYTVRCTCALATQLSSSGRTFGEWACARPQLQSQSQVQVQLRPESQSQSQSQLNWRPTDQLPTWGAARNSRVNHGGAKLGPFRAISALEPSNRLAHQLKAPTQSSDTDTDTLML